ncbi:MAG: tripartite tricarboxylate transporter substrate-binding protein, partial [Betaproteobacteria bacterium]
MIQNLSFSFSLSSTLTFIGLGLLTIVTSAQAQAQAPTASTYPNKPVKVVVGFAPGGAADYVARTISDSLGKSLGQPIIVENKAGAGSSIAAEAVSKSAPDGYTVLIASPSSISVNPALNPKL